MRGLPSPLAVRSWTGQQDRKSSSPRALPACSWREEAAPSLDIPLRPGEGQDQRLGAQEGRYLSPHPALRTQETTDDAVERRPNWTCSPAAPSALCTQWDEPSDNSPLRTCSPTPGRPCRRTVTTAPGTGPAARPAAASPSSPTVCTVKVNY